MAVERTEILGGSEFFRRQASHRTEIAPTVALADIDEILQQQFSAGALSPLRIRKAMRKQQLKGMVPTGRFSLDAEHVPALLARCQDSCAAATRTGGIKRVIEERGEIGFDPRRLDAERFEQIHQTVDQLFLHRDNIQA